MSIALRCRPLAGLICLVAFGSAAAADDQQTIKLGPVTIVAPKDWKYKKPTGNIISHEYTVPASKEDKSDGRFTVSSTGGSVDDNIKRWYAQVTPEDDDTARAKPEKTTIAGHSVHFVELTGTFRGPGAAPQKGYRVLGAVVQTDDGNLYLKLVGPQRTIAEQAKAFRKMVEEMKSK